MNIIVLGNESKYYLAKLHESYRKGLRSFFNTKFWGEGYAEYDSSITSIIDVKEILFNNEAVDLVILAECYDPRNWRRGADYTDFDKLHSRKAIMLCDFWSETDDYKGFKSFIREYDIDYILSFFLYPILVWNDSEISNKLIWFPPSFDPCVFNDWKGQEVWDVGNLNASTLNYSDFYPERFKMHNVISNICGIKYLTARHPGYGNHEPSHPLVGKNFSRIINSCKLFVTSGNMIYKNFAPKYVEIMASHTCLLAFEPLDSTRIGLIDGVNYVRIDGDNLEEKVKYYLSHDSERERIAKAGYELVIKNYSCYSLALRLFDELEKRNDLCH